MSPEREIYTIIMKGHLMLEVQCFSIPCLSSNVAQSIWMLGLFVKWILQARLNTFRVSSTLRDSRYWTYCACESKSTYQMKKRMPFTVTAQFEWDSYPSPQLFIQSTSNKAALKEDLNSAINLGNRTAI